jgi:RNA polymerase sigma-70 factor, ECF subfamily
MIDQERIEKAILQVRDGNLEYFRDVVSETVVLLRAYVSLFVHEDHMVDDILSEVYVQIYQRLDRYEIGTNFKAWIKTIAWNVAMSMRTKSIREKDRSERHRQELMECLNQDAQAEESLDYTEQQLHFLHTCLERLEQKARSWVDLHYFQGLSLESVATGTGASANAVAVGLHRARKALSNCMTREKNEREH